MDHITDSTSYPQFLQAENASRDVAVDKSDLTAWRCWPAVSSLPRGILSLEREEGAVLFTCGTAGKAAVHSFTHETPMDLYREEQPTVDRLYLRLEVWSDRIFRIRFSREETPSDPFAGIPEDARMLIGKPEKTPFTVEEKEDRYEILTREIRVSVDKANARVRAAWLDGSGEFYSQRRENFQTDDIHDLSLSDLEGAYACFEALDLDTDELIYGLGERFDSLTRNGRAVDFHNKDAVGTTSPRTYVNIPFYMSTRGYGLFLNTGAKVDWQIGTRDASALQFCVADDQIDCFVIPGRTPKEILASYCGLTGFSKLPPLWSFGLWMSRNSYVSWDVAEDVAENVRSHDIPCDVLHLDTAWFTTDWDCDLKFSPERFPDPEGHMARLKEKGFHISLWQYNFIPPNEDNTHYQEAVEHGYLSKNAAGEPYQLPEECQGGWVKDVTVDFSNPEAREWYAEKIRALIRMGAGAIKTDFGEGIAEEALYHSIQGRYFHNLYSLVYNSTVFKATHDVSGENIVWARSGTAGSQRYPLHWGGDSQCTFDALAATLRGALTVGISGIPFFSHDIGGFIGTPTDELYVRWAQLGLFSSHSRCHGCGDRNHREPWMFSEEACRIFRFYDKLRYSLMPYIYSEAEKCTHTGLPMMRALWLEYPEDRNVRHIDDQYLFGDSLLIAPVLKPLSKSPYRDVYLPEGVWFDYFTKEKIRSHGQWIRRKVDLATMPIYVKEGAVLSYCSADESLANGMGEIVKTEHWV